jgi:hypothetical protein
MPSILAIAVAFLLLLVLSVAELYAAWRALRRSRWTSGGISVLFGVVLLALAALTAAIAVATRGYRALTQEDLAATVQTEPLPRQHFRATIIVPGRVGMYDLAGDAFYVDGYIVRWNPVFNLLGLHPVYELDRVAGRYSSVTDERTKPHTVYSLARPKSFTMFGVVKRLPLLAPLIDAAYGSATFTPARRPGTFHVLVSPTGLLIRSATP